MQCKCLESKVHLIPDGGDEFQRKEFELEYYLLESTPDNVESYGADKVYGFEIIKRSSEGIEKESIKDFCTSREDARNVLKKLAENTVTPMFLSYIIDDLIGI